ncbi:MAG: DUF1272 domain-containing protein [Xanthomonadales bacterium]|nr:DUF1272 domain-containing protein [Xanthomonadales bacterium]
MLILKPNCESCGTDLPPNSTDAMICSYECTFCRRCAEVLLHNICPNCGGGFQARPIRPEDGLQEHPASTEPIEPGVDQEKHLAFLRRFRGVPPERR